MSQKFNECYVDMQFLNPGLWLYSFAIDKMCDLGKELKPQSIIRIMTGYLNLQNPKIPISYIPKSQVHRVITGRRKLRKYTNLEEICIEEYPDIHDSARLERKIKGNANYIIKRLTDDEFRHASLFKSILINAKGLYENVDNFSFRIDEFMRLRRMADLQNTQTEKEAVTNYHDELVENNSVDEDSRNLALRLTPIPEESFKNTSQNFDEFLSQIYNNCKTCEDFVQSTNVAELAAKRLRNLNVMPNSSRDKEQLIEIIIQNTWNQVQTHYKTYTQVQNSNLPKSQGTLANHSTIIRQFTLDQIKSRNELCDTQTVQKNITRYANIDKPIIPFTYLTGLHNLFPNLYTFVKYTNVIRLLKQNYGLNVKDVTKNIREWYNDLLKNPQTQNEKYYRLKINAKYLCALQYDEALSSYNTEMLEEEIYRHFDVPSFVSYVLPAFPEGIPSGSSDVPNKKFVPQKPLQYINGLLQDESSIKTLSVKSIPKSLNISMDYIENRKTESIENIELDKARHLNTTKSSSKSMWTSAQVENIQSIDILPNTASNRVEILDVIVLNANISENVKKTSIGLSEAPLISSTQVPTALNNIQEGESFHNSPQNDMNQASEYILSDEYSSPAYISETATPLVSEPTKENFTQQVACEERTSTTQIQVLTETPNSSIGHNTNVQSQPFCEQQHMIHFPINRSETIGTISQTNEHPENPTTINQSMSKYFEQKFKPLNDFVNLSKSYDKQILKEKNYDLLNEISHTQKLVEPNMSQSNSDDGNDSVDLNVTLINPENELIIKSEIKSPYSPYSQDVEIISNVSELIEVEDSMTVSQLLASDDDEMQNNKKQKKIECYDLLRELNLNESANINCGLPQRIDTVIDEPNGIRNVSDDIISQNLELSYSDLVQHRSITVRKRERRKRKAEWENMEAEMINGRKVKPVDLRNSSHPSIQNQHLTTASQLLNSQISLFLDSQLSVSKQTPPKQPKTPLASTSKENNIKNRVMVKRRLYENKPPTKPYVESNLATRPKLVDYNIIIKSLHNFKLINVKFLKKYYIQNRNKYIFSQNIHGNEDRISATLYAKYDRFTIRNQHLYKILNLNKKQVHALKTLLNMYETYEFKLLTNYNCDVSLLILHLYFRTLPNMSQNALILNVDSKDVENLFDQAKYVKYKYNLNGFNRNELNELYHSTID